MMRLDVRQESTRHTEVMDAITTYLGMGSYAAWDEVSVCDGVIRGRLSRPKLNSWTARFSLVPKVSDPPSVSDSPSTHTLPEKHPLPPPPTR